MKWGLVGDQGTQRFGGVTIRGIGRAIQKTERLVEEGNRTRGDLSIKACGNL